MALVKTVLKLWLVNCKQNDLLLPLKLTDNTVM